jgi:hypothetical protein
MATKVEPTGTRSAAVAFLAIAIPCWGLACGISLGGPDPAEGVTNRGSGTPSDASVDGTDDADLVDGASDDAGDLDGGATDSNDAAAD